MLQKPDDPTRPATCVVTIARGKSMQDGSGRVYLPGETVEVAIAELAHMRAGGWIVDTEAEASAATVVRHVSRLAADNPAFIGLQSRQEM